MFIDEETIPMLDQDEDYEIHRIQGDIANAKFMADFSQEIPIRFGEMFCDNAVFGLHKR